MRYLSVCSGIEAATVAWHSLGWTPAAFSEIEAFPRAVLAHHYPAVPCHGDFTTIQGDEYGPIDLLVGGTPCQSFSIAGLRGGMDDERGNLALEFLKLADRARPRWLVWENVPGVLSSNDGRDFGSFLGALVELGYGFSYRILDAQFFGVAQRRRRVFVVGHARDWRCAAAVLFERHSLQGNPAPRREKGQGIAGTLESRTDGGGFPGTDGACSGHDVPAGSAPIASTGNVPHCLNAGGMGRQDYETETLVTHSLRAEGCDASEDGTGRGTPIVPVAFSIMPMNSGKDFKARETDVSQPSMAGGPVGGNQGGDYIATIQERATSENPDSGPDGAGFRDDGAAYTLEARTVPKAVAFMENQRAEVRTSEVDNLTVGGGKPGQGYPAAMQGAGVRRLTPVECERLQGFPDGYTAVPYRGKAAADGPRYKALGNSMAVPCMLWLGQRIVQVEAISARRAAA